MRDEGERVREQDRELWVVFDPEIPSPRAVDSFDKPVRIDLEPVFTVRAAHPKHVLRRVESVATFGATLAERAYKDFRRLA